MVEVNQDNLDYILETFIEGFNDCACCPMSLNCEKRESEEYGIDSQECGEILLEWLKEE